VEVSVMRRWIPVLVLLVAAVFPGSALADPPVNDTVTGAAVLPTTQFYTNSVTPITVQPTGPAGGWLDATTSDEDSVLTPTCTGAIGFHSMWYTVAVAETSVLTVTLTSADVSLYQPVVSILGPEGTSVTPTELACGLGGNDSRTRPYATASSYVPKGTYLVRIASVIFSTGSDAPPLTLTGVLRDVTPPAINVNIPNKVLGPGEIYRFDARGSSDAGSGISELPGTVVWQFFESGTENHPSRSSSNPLIGVYAWRTPGLHRVVLQLQDRTGNRSTYTFFVLVHNIVAPKVALGVFPPSPGDKRIRLTISHDVPVSVRLVVMQRGRVLASVPAKRIKGTGKSTVRLALKGRVSKNGFVVVSGVASDLSQPPNTVPFPMCSVDPVHGGGKCA
jgi:hypothetical protein